MSVSSSSMRKGETLMDTAVTLNAMNRIGDLGFLIAIFWMISQFGSTGFAEVFAKASSGTTVTIITLLLFIGATGKSAQIPLYTWLPDAMAGPTPVSALIHETKIHGEFFFDGCNRLHYSV